MKKAAKYISLFIGVIVLIPLDLNGASAMTYEGNSVLHRTIIFLFMLLAYYLDVPAVAISFVRPRLGSLMILSSAGLSLAFLAAFLIRCGKPVGGDFVALTVVFWGVKLIVGGGIRYAASDGHSKSLTAEQGVNS